MTLIEVRNSEGAVGRCDAKCYNAQHEVCDCVCRGANHGAGFEQARTNTQNAAERWVQEARADGWDITNFRLGENVANLTLF